MVNRAGHVFRLVRAVLGVEERGKRMSKPVTKQLAIVTSSPIPFCHDVRPEEANRDDERFLDILQESYERFLPDHRFYRHQQPEYRRMGEPL